MRVRKSRWAPNVSRRVSHIRKVSATTTAITRKSLENDMPPGSCWFWLAVADTPMMKSRMPCQVA